MEKLLVLFLLAGFLFAESISVKNHIKLNKNLLFQQYIILPIAYFGIETRKKYKIEIMIMLKTLQSSALRYSPLMGTSNLPLA
jgi:hypothetical protein